MITNYEEILEYWETQKPIRNGKGVWCAIGDAIDKQIPKKINKSDCPRCGLNIDDLLDSPYCYCRKCGQKIEKR